MPHLTEYPHALLDPIGALQHPVHDAPTPPEDAMTGMVMPTHARRTPPVPIAADLPSTSPSSHLLTRTPSTSQTPLTGRRSPVVVALDADVRHCAAGHRTALIASDHRLLFHEPHDDRRDLLNSTPPSPMPLAARNPITTITAVDPLRPLDEPI